MRIRTLFIALLVLLVCVDAIEGARSRSRNRKRTKGRRRRRRGNCHMKAIDRCLNKAEKLSNDPDSSILITTDEGIDQICSASKSVVKCMKGFMKKCGTPLQRELFDFMNDGFSKSVNTFCADSKRRKGFLEHSPCMHDKVLNTPEYKESCTNPFLAGIDLTKAKTDLDDRLDLTCCSFNRWETCLYDRVNKECGADAKKSMLDFLLGAFANQAKLICNDAAFDFKAKNCLKVFPPPGTKANGKLSDNPLTKYISNYFGFLF